MKGFVEIQYFVFWKLCFDQSYFWLVETIIRIWGKQFLKKELILASGQLIFWLVKTIFFLQFSETPASFFSSSGKVFFKEILIFGYWKRSLEILIVSTSRKNGAKKKILFPINKNSDSTIQNKEFVKKTRFHYADKLLSQPGISKKTSKKWLPIVGYSMKNSFTLI